MQDLTCTYTFQVSGGEIAIAVYANGARRYWMNGRRIGQADAIRKAGCW